MSHDCDHGQDLADYGCDRCDAEVILTADPVHADICWLKVRHAIGCPFIDRVRASRNN